MTAVKSREYLQSELAVLASVVLHALAFAIWAHGDRLVRLTGFKPVSQLASAMLPVTLPEPVVPTITFIEEPRTFIETDAGQFTGEQPERATLYSSLPTVAANPENPTGALGDTPYLDGMETRVMSTETVVPTFAARPAPPAPPPPAPVEQPQPKVAEEGVKLAEEPKLVAAAQPPAPPAPVMPPVGSQREIASIKSRLTAAGAGRIGVAAFNVAGSPFGEYDRALIRAVQTRWYRLIEANGLYERAGTVTLHFNLMPDGSVQNMEVRQNSAGQILGLFCEKAVVDSSPFAPLPEHLRLLIGSDPREVNFTFYY